VWLPGQCPSRYQVVATPCRSLLDGVDLAFRKGRGGLHNLICEKVAQDRGCVKWTCWCLVLDPTKEQRNVAPSFFHLHQSPSSSVSIFISLHLHQSPSSSVPIFISLHLHQSPSSSVSIFISLHLHQSLFLPSPIARINFHLLVSTKSISSKRPHSKCASGNRDPPHRARRVHGPPPLSRSIRTASLPIARSFPPSFLSNHANNPHRATLGPRSFMRYSALLLAPRSPGPLDRLRRS
jgi:hypothetical protein